MAAEPLPDPLTPAEADLRDFRFMPLDVVRFAQSDLVAFEDPAAVLANTLLWCASWHSLPAGSLTDDDRVLARLAGYGRGGSEWEAIRDGARRGWIKCSDGRLYHRVVAEKVIEAWEGRIALRHRRFCAAIRKHNERNPDNKLDSPSFDDWDAAGRPDKVTRDNGSVSRVTGVIAERDGDNVSQRSHAQNSSKGQGTGDRDRGQGTGDRDYPSGKTSRAARGTRLPADWQLPPEWRNWAASDRGWSERQVSAEAEKFRDFWWGKAGPNALKVDWLATWRGWCRRADEGGSGADRRGSDEGYSIGGTRMMSPC